MYGGVAMETQVYHETECWCWSWTPYVTSMSLFFFAKGSKKSEANGCVCMEYPDSCVFVSSECEVEKCFLESCLFSWEAIQDLSLQIMMYKLMASSLASVFFKRADLGVGH